MQTPSRQPPDGNSSQEIVQNYRKPNNVGIHGKWNKNMINAVRYSIKNTYVYHILK
jgi:hypothetical protein